MNSTKETSVPTVPGVRLDDRVNERLEALLARCDQLRRGTTITRPTKFNARGQAHANRIAQQDRNRQ